MKSFSVLSAGALAATSFSQVMFTGGTHSEDFNSLITASATVTRPTSSTATANVAGQAFTNDFGGGGATLPGWAVTFSNAANVGANPPSGTNGNWINAGVVNSPTPHTIPDYNTRFIRYDDGTNIGGSVYNYGLTNGADRSFGILNSGGPTSPLLSTIGFAVKNDAAGAISDFAVSYVGRQWRNGGSATQDRLNFSYQIFAAGAYDVNALRTNTGWTSLAALDFAAPVFGGTAGKLDGTLPANSKALASPLSGVVLQPGEILAMRWNDIDVAGSDSAMAIDNFTLTSSAPVPEPASMAVLGLGLAALRRRRNRK